MALTPSSSAVAPGAEFDIDIRVTQPGSVFNGFDAIVGYDAAALTLIPLSPLSLQEGSYMTAACGSRFHRFRQGADRDTATDVLLCSGVALPGPGQIYRLHFRASPTPQVTWIRFQPGLRFYNNGLYVTPVSSSDGMVRIGEASAVDGPVPSFALRLAARPNPARLGTTLDVQCPRAGVQELRVCDIAGRTVRHLGKSYFAPGARTSFWDGLDDTGVRLSPGIYRMRLYVAGRWTEARVTLLD